ncbi:hypothetical protein ACOSQ4_022783 [Xanthoceras sorbifolium]
MFSRVKIQLKRETVKANLLFMMGLEKYGKGDWRSISRNCIVDKNPTQVASHAQKYFIRLENSQNNYVNSASTTTAIVPTLALCHYEYVYNYVNSASTTTAIVPTLALCHYEYVDR